MDTDKKIRILVGIGVVIVVLSVYIYTLAPSTSFWDCGEFIACSYILGVPHPPGTPLQVLIGRLFTLIPISKEIAYRMNFYSALSGALAALFIYLVFVKLIERFRKPQTWWEKLVQHTFGAATALIASFTFTNWDTSVEAEVYSTSSFIIFFCIWITLCWQENIGKKTNKNLLLLVVYITFLSMGIHLLPLLVLPGLIVFILLVKPKELMDANLFLIGIILVFIAISTYYYLIIRARLGPGINEVAPKTFDKLWDVFSRKQYGPMKFFPRKTATQTGYNVSMAVWQQILVYVKYFSWQFAAFPREFKITSAPVRFSSAFITWLYALLGFWGFWSHFRRDKKTFAFIWIIFLFTSLGLILYLNLRFSPSDPNPFHKPKEVRERDYFYSTSFLFFSLFMGIGLWNIAINIIETIQKKWKTITAIALSIIIFSFAAVPLLSNFNSHVNRRGNWIANDYGKNLLMSCADGSIIFTNGDNDTFPLWFVQEVKNFRKYDPETHTGVIIANLSLLNTDWYIKELKEWGAPISFTDREIDQLRPVRIPNGEVLYIKELAIRNMIATNSGRDLPPQDLFGPRKEFIEKYLKDYEGKFNIYFAVTVSRENMKGYEKNLQLEALAYEIVPEGTDRIDAEKSERLLMEEFSYRGIFNDDVYKDHNTIKLLSNYAAGFFALGTYLKNHKKYERAKEILEFGKEFAVKDPIPFAYNLAEIYKELDEYDKAEKSLREVLKQVDSGLLYYMIGQLYEARGNDDQALINYQKAKGSKEDRIAGYAGLATYYFERGDTLSTKKNLREAMQDPQIYQKLFGFFLQSGDTGLARYMLEDYLEIKPDDENVKKILNQLK
jgi:tetratricopeptide (TPR) repeat protein